MNTAFIETIMQGSLIINVYANNNFFLVFIEWYMAHKIVLNMLKLKKKKKNN